ncbi:MAG: phosphatase PAP2 family protein [Treponema sp.]|jgi:membrane-associated phospholipid phosphatase|nr:phosphatase PAP2 family protein [Treponema sp.]
MDEIFTEAVLSRGSSSPYGGGLDFIQAIQEYSNPSLTALMKAVTNIVSEYVFFAVIMILFWVVNEKKAFRFGVFMLLSLWLNTVLKFLFKQPRPFHLENSLGMIGESGYGLPSGHAQLVLAFVVPLALWLVKTAKGRYTQVVFALSGAAVLLVSFSRLYLGVHFPQDILAGWILGGLSLILFFSLEGAVEKLPPGDFSFIKKAFPGTAAPPSRLARITLMLSSAVSLLMIILPPREILPGAVFFGFTSGYILAASRLSFTAKSGRRFPAALFRLAVGFAGTALLYAGLKLVFPGSDSSWYTLFRFIRYAAVGFWVSFASPWVFENFARRQKQTRPGCG